MRCATATGMSIDAWVVRPRGRRSKGLVLQIHGGPHCAHGPAPWLEMVALADAGFTVLYGNPRGSQGYGEAFGEGDRGQLGRGGRLRSACVSSTGRYGRSLRPATTSACSGSPTAAT